MQSSNIPAREPEAQEAKVTCSRSHSSDKVPRDLNFRLPASGQDSDRWGLGEEVSGGVDSEGPVRPQDKKKKEGGGRQGGDWGGEGSFSSVSLAA